MAKAIIITGASSGIGRDAAVKMAKKGYRVFAGVRNQKAVEELASESPNITPLILDVTKPEQIEEAFRVVSRQPFDEFHLVNNAGIAVVGTVEHLPIAEFKNGFEVNFFGLIHMTQKFIPLLRKYKGRIVNVSSLSGLAPSPFLSAYSASKFAVEALSDVLRWELASAGIKVIIVEPGPIATPIWEKGLSKESQILDSIPLDNRSYYAGAARRFAKIVKEESRNAIPVSKVTDVIERALTAKNPPLRSIVASSAARIQHLATRFLPQKFFDLAIQKGLFKN